jgi:hypothetical protein
MIKKIKVKLSHKEENGKLSLFQRNLADYDEERVYPSDIKKN